MKPEMDRKAALRLGLLLSLPALLLNPVVITVDFGQVNLVVTLLVMWDLLSQRRIGSWQAPLGVATGLAAAVKLTPILFVPYLILTRRTRGAVTCVVTFVVCELVTFLLSPDFIEGLLDTRSVQTRTRRQLVLRRQPEPGGRRRATPPRPREQPRPAPVLATVAAGGLWLAALAHRRSSPMLGLLICAATGLLVSPISWVHHMVWVDTSHLWLGLAKDRPRFGVPLAIGTAVLFWIAPIWWVPYVGASDLHLNAWQLVAGNSFFFAVVLFVVGAAVLLTAAPRFVRQSDLVVNPCLAEADLPRVRSPEVGLRRPPDPTRLHSDRLAGNGSICFEHGIEPPRRGCARGHQLAQSGRCRGDGLVPIRGCTVEQLVPEDGPATGDGVTACRRHEQPGQGGDGPGSADQPRLCRRRDPVVRQMVGCQAAR